MANAAEQFELKLELPQVEKEKPHAAAPISNVTGTTLGEVQDLCPGVLNTLPDNTDFSGVKAHLVHMSHENRVAFLSSLESASSLLRARSLLAMAELEANPAYKNPAIAHYQELMQGATDLQLEVPEVSEIAAYYFNKGEELFESQQFEEARARFATAYDLYKKLTQAEPQNFIDNNRSLQDCSYYLQKIAKALVRGEDNYIVTPLGTPPLGYAEVHGDSELRH